MNLVDRMKRIFGSGQGEEKGLWGKVVKKVAALVMMGVISLNTLGPTLSSLSEYTKKNEIGNRVVTVISEVVEPKSAYAFDLNKKMREVKDGVKAAVNIYKERTNFLGSWTFETWFYQDKQIPVRQIGKDVYIDKYDNKRGVSFVLKEKVLFLPFGSDQFYDVTQKTPYEPTVDEWEQILQKVNSVGGVKGIVDNIEKKKTSVEVSINGVSLPAQLSISDLKGGYADYIAQRLGAKGPVYVFTKTEFEQFINQNYPQMNGNFKLKNDFDVLSFTDLIRPFKEKATFLVINENKKKYLTAEESIMYLSTGLNKSSDVVNIYIDNKNNPNLTFQWKEMNRKWSELNYQAGSTLRNVVDTINTIGNAFKIVDGIKEMTKGETKRR